MRGNAKTNFLMSESSLIKCRRRSGRDSACFLDRTDSLRRALKEERLRVFPRRRDATCWQGDRTVRVNRQRVRVQSEDPKGQRGDSRVRLPGAASRCLWLATSASILLCENLLCI